MMRQLFNIFVLYLALSLKKNKKIGCCYFFLVT